MSIKSRWETAQERYTNFPENERKELLEALRHYEWSAIALDGPFYAMPEEFILTYALFLESDGVLAFVWDKKLEKVSVEWATQGYLTKRHLQREGDDE